MLACNYINKVHKKKVLSYQWTNRNINEIIGNNVFVFFDMLLF